MKILIILSSLLFLVQSFAKDIDLNNLDKKINSLKELERSYLSNKKVILSGFENNFIKVEMEIFPSVLVKKIKERKYPFASQYNLVLLNEKHELIYQIPLGDPFNLYAEHFGHEDEKSIFPIKNPYIEVSIPVSIDPTFIRLDNKSGDQLSLGEELKIYIR
tara:strand:- start:212 stop:694 length:483 start_codon:yes stop_codon:yes gene_type:complete